MMNIKWNDYIESNVNILHGKPCIKNTRIPVSLILGYLAAQYSKDEIIKEFPGLRNEHISACLDYARELADFEIAI